MPFRPGTGIPYGISPFAFSAGAAEAANMVGPDFSSLADFDGSSSGLASGWDVPGSREVGRREVRMVFLV